MIEARAACEYHSFLLLVRTYIIHIRILCTTCHNARLKYTRLIKWYEHINYILVYIDIALTYSKADIAYGVILIYFYSLPYKYYIHTLCLLPVLVF